MCAEIRRCSLIQIQLEQDSGKSLYDADSRQCLVDLNRAGGDVRCFLWSLVVTSTSAHCCLMLEMCGCLSCFLNHVTGDTVLGEVAHPLFCVLISFAVGVFVAYL